MTDDYLERIKSDDAPDLEKDEPKVMRKIGNIELRYDSKGEIDEILLSVDGDCVFHMERMDKRFWWSALYDDENDFCLHINMTSDDEHCLPIPVLADWPDDEEDDKS
jgi:hypothetical protein